MDSSYMFCNVMTYILHTLYDLYPWISAINSIDRVFSLKYPSKFKFFKKFKYQALTISIILAALLLINVPHYLYDDSSNTTLSLCNINSPNIGFYLYLANLIISMVLPFVIMLFSTFFIFHHLMRQSQRVHENNVDYNREKDFIKSVLSMDLWFLICYSPICVVLLLQYTSLFNFSNREVWKLIFDVFAFLSVAEISFNFFLYYFCNRVFKKYFHSMFSYCRK